ncbi:MAG: D-alanine--D-alanine ligase [Planctomycetota bacterium]
MSDERLDVVVLMGGPDAEREVSLQSGHAVAAALRNIEQYVVRDVVIDKPTAADLRAISGDVIVPMLHGTWGEGGELQALLETIGLPFVGADSTTARLAMDKIASKRCIESHGVPTPPAFPLRADEPCPLPAPCVIKPMNDGSSVDLRICQNSAEIDEARTALHARRDDLMVEAYIRGREVTVGFLDGQTLPLIEIVPAAAFYDYEAKYERDDTAYRIEPDDLPFAAACVSNAEAAIRAIGVRDLARVDFIVDEHGPWFLEINTMPGFTDHSLVPMAAQAVGLSMSELCQRLVECARRRGLDAQKSNPDATISR